MYGNRDKKNERCLGGSELGSANQFGMIALFQYPLPFWFNATKKSD